MASPSEQELKQDARELLWAAWTKCQPSLSRARIHSGTQRGVVRSGMLRLPTTHREHADEEMLPGALPD